MPIARDALHGESGGPYGAQRARMAVLAASGKPGSEMTSAMRILFAAESSSHKTLRRRRTAPAPGFSA